MFASRSECDALEGSSTGLFGGNDSLRNRIEGATKSDDLVTKAMVKPKVTKPAAHPRRDAGNGTKKGYLVYPLFCLFTLF